MSGPLITEGPFTGLERGAYRAICADPPWHHVTRSQKGQTRRAPSRHYKTMSTAEIAALPVSELAAKDCHLFLWTTWPHLPQALEVMKAWGFKYSSGFLTWVKLNPRSADEMFITADSFHLGQGYTSRKNTEILLIGRRGSPKRENKGVRELMIAARREHSRKPDEARVRIMTYCQGPYLELFSRETAEQWTSWGNEVGKFSEAAE